MIEYWNCPVCKTYNDILTNRCVSCLIDKPEWITTYHQAIIEIRRDVYLHRGCLTMPVLTERERERLAKVRTHLDNGTNPYDSGAIKTLAVGEKREVIQRPLVEHSIILEAKGMSQQEELFAKFYNQERVLVKDMDVVQLREHREELAKIAFEAKARLVATDEETRERGNKGKNKEWLLTADSSQVNSDAINAVKVRKERMTKMDKMRSQLLAAGIDEDTVKEMIKTMERKATETTVKAITFSRPTTEMAAVIVDKEKLIAVEEPKVPFNPSSLFGK